MMLLCWHLMNMSGVDYAIDVTLRVVRVAERSPENSS